MTDELAVYRQQAAQYDRLKAREDFAERLLPALRFIRPFEQADIVEWGAGTGWVSERLAPLARSLVVCDLNASMLKVASEKLRGFDHLQWQAVVSDHRQAPLPDQMADVSLAAWSLCYLARNFRGEGWQHEITQALQEMQRVLRPNGTTIIIETLGTGSTEPQPPHDWLGEYYAFLGNECGFASSWVRTDYRFASLDEAVELLSFFWNEDFGETARRNNWIITPECTGIWWKEAG